MRSHRQYIKNREKSFRRQRVRTFILFVFLELFFVLLIYRLFSIQCIQGDIYRGKAEAQQVSQFSIGGKRGDIYDRNLQPLAIKIKSYSLYADPSNLKDWDSAARLLSPILEVSKEEIIQKLRSSSYFVWLRRHLPDGVVNQISSMGIRGMAFREENKRFYPKGSLAAHVIGFVGVDNIGLEGVEKAYDQYIRGNTQEVEAPRDRKGRNLKPIKVGCDKITVGYDLVLTIDEVIQNMAEKALQEACRNCRAAGGSVIVMNPRTGEILALANYPTYDLNNAFSSDEDHRRNRAIRDLYEPGSVFKIITASAAINESLFTPGKQIDCEGGVYTVNGRTIHDGHSYNLLTFSQVVEKSSNIGITKVANQLGSEKLYRYIQGFGLNGKTGIDLSESFGFVRPLEEWTNYSMASIPYGQEFSVTPLQMLCSINAIANDGIIMKPFIVRGAMKRDMKVEMQGTRQEKGASNSRLVGSVRDKRSEFVIQFLPEQAKAPISSRTAKIMTEILTNAVESGTGREARVDGYKVAGKTGTAQKASGEGGYIPGKYVSSFAGFLPAGNPQVSIIVVINEPQGVYDGGAVACPVFSEIATQVMQYLNLGQRFYVSAKR